MTTEYSQTMTLEKFWELFDGPPLGHLATLDRDRPRVRMMSFTIHDGSFWIVTIGHRAKVRQLEQNNNIEISISVRGDNRVGAVRINGLAVLIKEKEVRANVASVIPWFANYFSSPDDPDYILYKVEMNQILVNHPKDGKKFYVDL
ncbi:MAG: pyridoxamine 5'-phosphate oxidase family protein [Candidatus Thorarchaeota archaeon]